MEQETFFTLLKDKAHWEFEIFLMFIFDIVIGLILWPIIIYFIWPKIKKACGCAVAHKSDCERILELEESVKELKEALGKRV